MNFFMDNICFENYKKSEMHKIYTVLFARLRPQNSNKLFTVYCMIRVVEIDLSMDLDIFQYFFCPAPVPISANAIKFQNVKVKNFRY